MDDHEHDWWANPFGPMKCQCGATRPPAPPPPKDAA